MFFKIIIYNFDLIKKLSEPFIEKFQDKVSWNSISIKQKLSESFIEKFKNKVNWIWISQNQKLSESFIEKFQDKIYWIEISKNKKAKISKRFLLRLYSNYNYEVFNILKQKPGLKIYGKKIEQQIPKLLIEAEK